MTISIDDYAKLDLRIGTILEAEPIAKTARLVRVVVDVGTEQRTLVAGVALAYEPAALVGLQVVVLANLAPRTIHGIESHGMLLGVGCDRPEDVALLTPGRTAENGARVM
jgi:methionyl-tRNA synthetase